MSSPRPFRWAALRAGWSRTAAAGDVVVDAPCFDRPVRVVWRKRTWRWIEGSCPTKVSTEQDEQGARPRALLTTRACWWAINQIRREHASIRGLARQLETTWNTVWTSIQPLLQEMARDETRFAGVKRLGVDEHVWHHLSEFPIEDGGRGPKQLTGMVDLTSDPDTGKSRARLLDMVPGRLGKAYSDEVRRRVQHEIHGHHGRKNDPLYGIRARSCGVVRRSSPTGNEPDPTRRSPPTNATTKFSSPGCAPSSSARPTRPRTRSRADGSPRKILPSFPTCPIPEIQRLGKTLKQWREAFLATHVSHRRRAHPPPPQIGRAGNRRPTDVTRTAGHPVPRLGRGRRSPGAALAARRRGPKRRSC